MIAEMLERRVLLSTYTWDGGGGTDHYVSTGSNWQGDVAPSNFDALAFPDIGAGHHPVDFDTSYFYTGLALGGPGYDLGGYTIELAGNISTLSSLGYASIVAEVHLHQNTTIDLAGNFDLNNYGEISGSYSLTKTGSGDLNLSSDNSYTGGTQFGGGGTLQIANLTGSATGTGVVTIGSGSTIVGDGEISGGLTLDSGATLAVGYTRDALAIFRTGSLDTATGSTLDFQLNGTTVETQYDRLAVTGTVDLNSATLSLRGNYIAAHGEQFVILSNDGSDPVVGQFDSLAQDDAVALNGRYYRISYVGGDGNDVELTCIGSARVWDGGGSDNNWMTAANWVGDVAPLAHDGLIFPSGASRLSNTNNFPAGTVFDSLTFSGSGYTLAGNRIALVSGVTSEVTTLIQVALPITLSADVQLRNMHPTDGSMLFSGAIDNAGHTLLMSGYAGTIQVSGVISGSGDVVAAGGILPVLSGNNTYTGDTRINATILEINGSQGSSDVLVTSSGYLTGSGTVGAVALDTGAIVSPGYTDAAILRTGGLSFLHDLTGFEFQIDGAVAGSGFDQIRVTGAVNLNDYANFLPTFTTSYRATPGQKFKIIDNDGADAVVGRFLDNGLGGPIVIAEGAVVTINDFYTGGSSQDFRISYVGGDGNDVELTCIPTVRTWDGGGADNSWMTAANWNGDMAPLPGDTLIFPPSATRRTNINNFPSGTAFDSISFTGGGYTLSGNRITLNDQIISNSYTPNEVATALTLGANATMQNDDLIGTLTLSGAINNAGHSLTFTGNGGTFHVNGVVSGSGAVAATPVAYVFFNANNAYTGATTINSAELTVNGSQSQTAVLLSNYSSLRGSGTAGAVTLDSGAIISPGDFDTNIVRTGNLTFIDNQTLYEAQINGATAGSGYDQVRVTGTVTLGDKAKLYTYFETFYRVAVAQSIKIIDNDGSDAVVGRFVADHGNGLQPIQEGDLVTVPDLVHGGDSQDFRISYVGGDGNDVVLTAVGPGVLSFSTPTTTVNENAGSKSIVVRRDTGSEGTVTVHYAATAGTADSNDFTAVSGTLTFAQGETSKTFVIPITSDDQDEENETINLVLASPTGGATLDGGNAVLSVIDDDPLPTLSINDPSGAEPSTGTGLVTFTVSLSQVSGRAISVDFSTAPGTAGNLDFVAATGTLTIPAGASSGTITVTILGDALREPDETLSVTLSNALYATLLDSVGQATVADTLFNTAPMAVDDSASTLPGQAVTITVLANDSDPDGDDLAVSTITTPGRGVAVINGASAIEYTPAAGFAGVDTFTYTLVDASGGESTASVTVNVRGAQVTVDPENPAKMALVIAAHDDGGVIRIEAGKKGALLLTNGSDAQQSFASAGRVVIVGGSGDDAVIATKVKIPVQFFGGDGNDSLAGGKKEDILIGGPGDDVLNGGTGADLIIGGGGSDTIYGGAGDDLIISGTTAYDPDTAENRQALKDILAAWIARGPRAAKLAAITGDAGVGDLHAKLNATTVFNDSAIDTLLGQAGSDVFFATTLSTPADVFSGRKPNEDLIEV